MQQIAHYFTGITLTFLLCFVQFLKREGMIQKKIKNVMLLQYSWATKVPKCVMPGFMPYRFGVKCECSVSGILR